MKISNETLSLLKNYAGINTNILFREGSTLATVSPGKNIFARATVSESFPKEFAIYDLNSFLGLLTLMEDQDVTFGEKSIRVTKDGSKFEYFYSDPGTVTAAPDKDLEIDPVWSFEMTTDTVNMIFRAASITGAPMISIVSDGNTVELRVGDPTNLSSNSFTKTISNTAAPVFDCRLKTENLKVIPDNYTVTLGSKRAMSFVSKGRSLTYYLAMDPSSSI
jgi:hypothetical protein